MDGLPSSTCPARFKCMGRVGGGLLDIAARNLQRETLPRWRAARDGMQGTQLDVFVVGNDGNIKGFHVANNGTWASFQVTTSGLFKPGGAIATIRAGEQPARPPCDRRVGLLWTFWVDGLGQWYSDKLFERRRHSWGTRRRRSARRESDRCSLRRQQRILQVWFVTDRAVGWPLPHLLGFAAGAPLRGPPGTSQFDAFVPDFKNNVR